MAHVGIESGEQEVKIDVDEQQVDLPHALWRYFKLMFFCSAVVVVAVYTSTTSTMTPPPSQVFYP